MTSNGSFLPVALRTTTLVFALVFGCSLAAQSSEDPVFTGLQELASGDAEQAYQMLADVVARANVDTANLQEQARIRRAMIGAGDALRRLKRYSEAMQYFQAAVKIPAPNQRGLPLQFAIARCQLGLGQFETVMTWAANMETIELSGTERVQVELIAVEAICESGWPAAAWQRFEEFKQAVEPTGIRPRQWESLIERIGTQALGSSDAETALKAFSWCLTNNQDSPSQTCVLGSAWSLAHLSRHADAVLAFEEYFAKFPAGTHVERAKLAYANCLAATGNTGKAEDVLLEIALSDSQFSAQALSRFAQFHGPDELDPRLIPLTTRTITNATKVAHRSSELVASALITAAMTGDDSLWGLAADAFIADADAGPLTEPLLHQLGSNPTIALKAQEFAGFILNEYVTSASPDRTLQSRAESAMQWVAETKQWDTIATAAFALTRDARYRNMSPYSVRLMAEGLMHGGKRVQAIELFRYLVDEGEVKDFYSGLRLAELSLELDTKQEARRRIEDAELLADATSQRELVKMLRAQWLIRDARLPEAREQLTEILRDPTGTAELKPRAQWLVGETYFLQRDFVQAIAAYRDVEPLDATGAFTPLALMQAGRAFEQLGQTQQAKICYTALTSRFKASPYSQEASFRMATLQETTSKTR